MTTHLLIAAIFVVFVITFMITMFVLNASVKKIIDTNTILVEDHNMLVEQNKEQYVLSVDDFYVLEEELVMHFSS